MRKKFGDSPRMGTVPLLILSVTLAGGLLLGRGTVAASDVEVSCNESSCNPENLSSFLPDEKWYPGKSVLKSIRVNNISSVTQKFQMEMRNYVNTDDLAKAINLVINDSGGQLWSGTVESFKNQGEIVLSNIVNNFSKEYYLSFSMDSSIGNESRDKGVLFDLVLGFKTPDPTPTGPANGGDNPTPTLTPEAGAGAATSRFVIRNVINRERVVVTISPGPGGEVRGTGTGGLPSGNRNFWSLFGGAYYNIWPLFAIWIILGVILFRLTFIFIRRRYS